MMNKYYHSNKLICIGDAAHPFKPIGQGINMAMLDGMNLDLYISKISPNNLETALKLFSDSSKIEGDALIDLATSLESTFFKIKGILLYELGIIQKPTVLLLKDADSTFN